MINFSSRHRLTLATVFSWGMKLLLFFFFILETFVSQNYLVAIAALFALFIASLPSAIYRNYNINLPKAIDLLITLALFLHIVGLFYDFYHDISWWWWDNFTHFLGTAVIAILAFYTIFALHYVGTIKMTKLLMAISTWTTSLAIGAIWEVAEYYFDQFFGTKAVIDLADTIHDLIFDFLAGVAVSVVGVIYVHYLSKKLHGPK